MSYEFNAKEFLKLTEKADPIRYQMGSDRHQYRSTHEKYIETLKNNNYTISSVKSIQKSHGKISFLTRNAPHEIFAIRLCNKIIKSEYKISFSNRNRITRQIKEILNSSNNTDVLRIDIKKFYESIPIENLIEKIEFNSRIPLEAKRIIKSLYFSENEKVLHRGFSLSATLSEIFMKDIDKSIKSIEGVYYYARFVDDIIIFSSLVKKENELIDIIDSILSNNKLELNPKKTQFIKIRKNTSGSKWFDFLGYRFTIITNNKKLEIKTTMAEAKIKKIKSRFILAIKALAKENDKNLFFDRVKFLTGNYRIKGKERYGYNRLFSGIYFSYALMDKYENNESMKELDSFFKFIMQSTCSKYKKSIHSTLKNKEVFYTLAHTFKNGFEHKRIYRFSEDRIKAIKKIWETYE